MDFRKKIVPCTLLKKCALWEGSHEQFSFNYGGITAGLLIDTINMKRHCDDLTDNEKEYLAAMSQTLKDSGIEGAPEWP